jgi:hypothetical protein
MDPAESHSSHVDGAEALMSGRLGAPSTSSKTADAPAMILEDEGR